MVGTSIKPYSLEQENGVRKFWDTSSVKKKVRDKTKLGKQKFYFMDGPPYATGHIHMGTALNKIMKDCAIRSQRMQGKRVFDRPGYDTHGVPIESKVEKKLGFKTKKDIEEYGVENFIKECKLFATQFVDTMGKEFDNLGDWMDYSDPYLTLNNEYIEAIWYSFKKADEKNLLYLGKYPVHVCPHCATAVAFNEIEYTKLADTAIFVKLKVNGVYSDKSGANSLYKTLPENTYLVVWTTTPWTLPANTGVMVHPKFEYAFAKLSNGETWVVAKELLAKFMDSVEAGFILDKVVLGAELEGLKYDPLFDIQISPEVKKTAYRVILSDRYVTLDTGSGLVHTAPGHGKEDFDAGLRAGLPAISPVGLDGKFTSEAKQFEGKEARPTNEEIISILTERNLLPLKHSYTHDYPLCWRCDSPLLMISVPQWFLKVSEIRQKLLDANNEVNWVPVWMKDRMKNWTENLNDWPVSRARYWGAPLPIWTCSCGEKVVVGSIAELKKLANLTKDVELHKPYIDEVKIKCKCGKEMSRVPEVLDVWFDSGVSSWANLKFPQDQKLFDEYWPADLNIEMTEQVRGWWNSQSILSMICFNKLPYKAVSVHGMVRDLGKQKMSKSRGNAVSPEDMIQKYNRDYLRSYLLSQSKGTDFNFDEKGVGEIGVFFNTMTNSINYAKMYMNINLEAHNLLDSSFKTLLAEDKWFLSKLATLSEEMLAAYNSYEFSRAVVAFQNFVDKDFSRGYLQLIRQRLGTETQKQVDLTVSLAISSMLRLFSPIAPHASEYYFAELGGKDSIHLLDFLDLSKYKNPEFEESFKFAETLAQNVLALRSEQKLRLRWQLEELVIDSDKNLLEFSGVLMKMCNVKKVTFSKFSGAESDFAKKEVPGTKMWLKVAASKQLKDEWELSEILRNIQDMRKKMGLKPGQEVAIDIYSSDPDFVKANSAKITEKTSTKINLVPLFGKVEKL
ncbi:MAG: isoleucine--tRNA ligase, partial [archaeon]